MLIIQTEVRQNVKDKYYILTHTHTHTHIYVYIKFRKTVPMILHAG